ncbi:MAG: DUF1697 domain-containing protein [Oceanihabitans sp.]
MKKFIVLLKGINVGGHKKVPMATLREILTEAGFTNVKTYIQSGNIALESAIKSKTNIETKIQKCIEENFGFNVSVLATTQKELQLIFDSCPFSIEQKKASYFFLLHNSPNIELVKIASEKEYENEEYLILNNCIYYYFEKGLGKAKFNANYFERKLNTFATARNYNTMQKLLSL